MNMTVNHLPVLTWNQLKLNDASLQVHAESSEELYGKKATHCTEPELPEGITIEREVGADALKKRFIELGIDNPPEKIVAGKLPMYNRQRFATGMGAEVDELFESQQVPVSIYTVDASFVSETPVELHYVYPSGCSEYSRIFIHAKAGSECSILLYFSGEKNVVYGGEDYRQSNAGKERAAVIGAQTFLYLEEGAKVHLHVVQMLDEEAVFFHDIGAYSCRRSELTLTKLDLGAGKVYEGLNELQMGDKSSFSVDFGYLGLPGSEMDINYNDVFWGKKATGRMYFKEALLGDARKTFRGTIDFRQYSTGSAGDEQEDIILLGEDVVNKTIPLILCEEEDVDGRHASTIGSLAEDMLFYMQTRGISKSKAEEIMVRASISHISNMVPSETIRKAVKNAICRIFE